MNFNHRSATAVQKRNYKFKEEAVGLELELSYSAPEAAKSLRNAASNLCKFNELHEQQVKAKVLAEDER